MSAAAGKRGIGIDENTREEGKQVKTLLPRILYILTPYWLLGIEVADERKAESPSTALVPSAPSFETRIDLLKEGCPIGMGFVKSNSQSHSQPQIFFFGGFSLDDFRAPELDVNDPNKDVYALNRSERSLDPVQRFPEMQASKRRPIVEEFGDKIFVLHFGVNGEFNQRPILERLHVPSGEWKELPDIPGTCHSPGEAADQIDLPHFLVGYGHFVAFNKIFIPVLHAGGDIAYCFDMDWEVWDDPFAHNLALSFQEAELELPRFGRLFSGLGEPHSQHGSLILSPCYGVLGPLRLAAQMVHRSGRLLLYQELDILHLFRGLDIVEITDFQTLDLEDSHHMCLLVSLVLAGRPCLGALYMCIFEVVILHDILGNACCSGTFSGTPQSIEFIHAEIKEEHCYEMPELLDDDGPSSMKALFL